MTKKPIVTAVGHILKPKGDEKHLYHVIQRSSTTGEVKTIWKVALNESQH